MIHSASGPGLFTPLYIALAVLILMAIFIVPAILYLLTLHRAIGKCMPENQAMAPGLVWLVFVPLVNIVWHYFIVINVAKSLGAEFKSRSMLEPAYPGQSIGLAMCILFSCGVIPLLGILCVVPGLVCWIIYWVKIYGFSAKLDRY